MSVVTLPAWYYQQFDADYSLNFPGEGYGGWKKADLKLNTDKTAFVIMHAWDCGTYEQHPGWYRAVEYIPRANKIAQEVFPRLIESIRNSGVKLYHIAGYESYCKDYKGYKYSNELLEKYTHGKDSYKMPNAKADEVLKELQRFRSRNVFCGEHNHEDIKKGHDKMGFMKEVEPLEGEAVAINGDQLHAVCLEEGVNHLIYCGFAINWCLQYSPGSMNDMASRGLMCSVIRQAVTAVENKESARNEAHKEYALWATALKNGFVYDLQDIIQVLDILKIS